MFVYILFITVSYVVPNDDVIHTRAKMLNVFPTPAECASELARIKKDMEAAYPGDKDYALSCVKHQKISLPERVF